METQERYDDNIDMEKVADLPIDEVQQDTIIQGEVVTIDNEFAYVNIGSKTDGRVNLNEFKEPPVIGDIIDILLVNKRMIDGMYVFSRIAAEREKKWIKFLEQYREGIANISGYIEGTNNKGFYVNCDEVSGFMPFFLASDIRIKKDAEPKKAYMFKIKSIDEKRKSILISRKDYLDEENKKKWDSLLSHYKVGDKATGKVIKFVEFGAFIDVEGIEGLLHKNDMSWRKVFKPKKLMEIGEQREFVILNIAPEDGRLSLGLKQLTEDPWIKINDRYKQGDAVSGEIVTLTDFGVFVEIEEGIEGFIASSELSWTKKNINPKNIFKKGQKIETKILNINKDEKKISLGYKQLIANPWDTIEERFPCGSVHKGKVKKVVGFGIFVELEEGIDGLIHVSDISWDDNKDLMKQFSTGEEIEFKILEIKKDEMRIACGIKQLTKSPWEVIKERYPSRSKVSGVVSGVVPFGLFIKIDDDVEGLVHISEVSRSRIENLEDQYKIGDKVNAEVLGIDVERKRLSLSIKKYDFVLEKEELNRVLNDAGSKKATLGDFIKIKLED